VISTIGSENFPLGMYVYAINKSLEPSATLRFSNHSVPMVAK